MGMMNRKVNRDVKPGTKVKPRTSTGPGLTKQEFAHECDINHIMKRYVSTGQLSSRSDMLQPIFADVSNIGDYADVLRRIDSARAAFSQLPAEIRTRFGNSPEALVDFLQYEKNLDEAVKLGLIEAKPQSLEPKAPIVPDPKGPAVK